MCMLTFMWIAIFICPKNSVGALKEKSIQLSTWAITKACPFKDFICRQMKTH